MNKIYYPLIHVEEVIKILNKIAIFGGLSEKQLYPLFKLLKIVNYEEGEYIFKRGDEPSHIYIIKNGKVKILIDKNGSALEIITYGPGDCFGETSAIGIQIHSSSALVVENAELIVLERSALLNIFETDKELFGMLILNIARETARRLHQSDEVLEKFLLER